MPHPGSHVHVQIKFSTPPCLDLKVLGNLRHECHMQRTSILVRQNTTTHGTVTLGPRQLVKLRQLSAKVNYTKRARCTLLQDLAELLHHHAAMRNDLHVHGTAYRKGNMHKRKLALTVSLASTISEMIIANIINNPHSSCLLPRCPRTQVNHHTHTGPHNLQAWIASGRELNCTTRTLLQVHKQRLDQHLGERRFFALIQRTTCLCRKQNRWLLPGCNGYNSIRIANDQSNHRLSALARTGR